MNDADIESADLSIVQRKMGIEDDEASELADLEMETKPEDVLAEIERLHQRALSRNRIVPK